MLRLSAGAEHGAKSRGPLSVLILVQGICLWRPLLHLLIPPVHRQLSLPCSSLGLSPGYSLFSDHDFKVPVPGFPCSHHCLVVPQDPVWMSSLLTVLTLWGIGLHSFPQFSPSVADCPSLQISHLLDKLLSCALGLCMQPSEAICLERNPSNSLPNPFLILHSTSVKRSTIHHLEIWELPMLLLCPHPLESINYQVLSHLLP